MDWYYAEAGQQRGPVNETEFQNLIRAGTITGETLVWREGMANWRPYRDVAPAGGTASLPAGGPPAYVPPPAGSFPDQGRRNALDKVNGPAIGLIVTAIFGFLATAAGLLYALGGINFMPPDAGLDPNVQRMVRMLSGSLGLVNVLITAALSLLVLMGALRMRKLESHGLALAGSVVAVVPCISPCCIIGLPIGIWALVVLNKPEVKSQFQ